MYVGKTVDKHKGKFDWVLIAGALSSIVCVCVCVCVTKKVDSKKLCVLDKVLCCSCVVVFLIPAHRQHALMKQ